MNKEILKQELIDCVEALQLSLQELNPEVFKESIEHFKSGLALLKDSKELK